MSGATPGRDVPERARNARGIRAGRVGNPESGAGRARFFRRPARVRDCTNSDVPWKPAGPHSGRHGDASRQRWPRPGRTGHRGQRRYAAGPARVGARRLAGAARAIRKAGVPRAVRRRRGARDQQSASGRARICRVDAALGQDEPDAPRVAPCDVRGRSGCEDRAQSAGVLRIPQNGPPPAHAGPCPFERDLESPDCADEERYRARSPASR